MNPTPSARSLRAVDGQRVPFAERTFDLSSDPAPIEWAVENFAARGALTLLAAPTSSGKTWLALQLAGGIATGAEVAGLSCHAGRALYVDGENGPAIIAARARAAAIDPESFVYVDGAGLELERADVQAELADALRYHGATFVVLDSLRRLAPSVREDSSDDTARLLGALARLARETGAAILLQHHRSTKGGAAAVRGSSAIEDQSDVVFALAGKIGSRQRLEARKFRLGRNPDPLVLRFRDDPPGFVAERGSAQASLAREVAALADRVKADGSWTSAQISEALDLDTDNASADRRRLGRAIESLIAVGQWERVGTSRPARYTPTEAGLLGQGHA
jgi:hypothetical protein